MLWLKMPRYNKIQIIKGKNRSRSFYLHTCELTPKLANKYTTKAKIKQKQKLFKRR